jgi:hypothetical protein
MCAFTRFGRWDGVGKVMRDRSGGHSGPVVAILMVIANGADTASHHVPTGPTTVELGQSTRYACSRERAHLDERRPWDGVDYAQSDGHDDVRRRG